MVNTVERFLIQQDDLHLSVSDRGLCVDLLCFTALTLFTTRRNVKTGIEVCIASQRWNIRHPRGRAVGMPQKNVTCWNDLSTFFPVFLSCCCNIPETKKTHMEHFKRQGRQTRRSQTISKARSSAGGLDPVFWASLCYVKKKNTHLSTINMVIY